MNVRAWMAVALTASAMWVTGCGKSGGAGGEDVKMVPAAIDVEPGMVTPGVKVHLTVPEGWKQDDFFKDKWMPEDARMPTDAYVSANVSCGGMCEAAKMPEQIGEAMKSTLDNVKTGGGVLKGEQFKGSVEMLDSGDLPGGGKFHAFRTTYPEAPEGKARAIPATIVECYLHNEGDDFYVLVEAHAKEELAGLVWPSFKDSCKAAKYEVTAQPKR